MFRIYPTKYKQGPFQLTEETRTKAKELTEHTKNKLEKAIILYNHLNKIEYEHDYQRTLRNAEETYHNGGTCLEQSYLYIAMARAVNLRAGCTHVKITQDGRDDSEVGHACANLKIGLRKILVDLAYGEFDIKHKKVKHKSDKETYKEYFGYSNKDEIHPMPPRINKRKLLTFIMALVSAIAGTMQLYSLAQKNHLPQKTYKIIQRIID